MVRGLDTRRSLEPVASAARASQRGLEQPSAAGALMVQSAAADVPSVHAPRAASRRSEAVALLLRLPAARRPIEGNFS